MISIGRNISLNLEAWVRESGRPVLLVRGARQVGKTYSVRKLAKSFRRFLEINFLEDPRARNFFTNRALNPQEISSELSAFYNTPIVDGETLLFFDEVQECPEAVSSLRFFHEKRPDLHLVAAGSLLEFALAELPSFGVGRVRSLFVHPLTFIEYLSAAGEDGLASFLKKAGPGITKSPLHDKLNEHLRRFLFLGGLPAVIANFLERRDYNTAAQLIDEVRVGYEDDFQKYRGRVPETRLRDVLRSSALQAGKKFVHKHAYLDAGSQQVQRALELLCLAGLVHKIHHTSANGVPLGAEVDLKKFKTVLFDHGIYQRMLGFTPAELVVRNLDILNKGSLAEVFCGLELIAHSNSAIRGELFYWHRESKSSNAEVDYLLQVGSQIVPLEVKAATKGKMQSLHRFMAEKKTVLGVRCSTESFGLYDRILVLPLYALSELPRLVAELS